MQIVFLVIILLAMGGVYAQARPAPTATPQPPTTHYFLLNQQDDAYVLCADGQFTIEVNGVDSIHLICAGD